MSDERKPAYVNRARLCELLDICPSTLDNWLKDGFPKPGRHGKWNWAKVCRYMDGDAEPEIALPEEIDQRQEVRDALKEFRQARH